jgi:predicted AAA+ superfamily ATPase
LLIGYSPSAVTRIIRPQCIFGFAGLVDLLQPYSGNIIKRAVKTPKVYFLDTGLAAYLTRWVTPDVLEAGAMAGAD